jgi:hypothetical protein
MKNQLIPPPELAPPSVKHLTSAQKVKLWAQMVDEGDRIVVSNLRQKLGPAADIEAASLEWLERRNADHDRAIKRMISEMRRRERFHAG